MILLPLIFPDATGLTQNNYAVLYYFVRFWVSCILMYVYVAPPTPVGAWSMALGLRRRFEYYYILLL